MKGLTHWAAWCSGLGLVGLAATYALAFFWVSTDVDQGVIQRIFYIHVPAAWTAFLAFGLAAILSGVYLWLRDPRVDRAARTAVEGGMIFATVMLVSGPLWAKIAWGTYWTWEPRLTFTLVLWFIFLGYLLVRRAVPTEKGRRYAAVVAIVGALDIPFIHVSVNLFRSLHPGPVVIQSDGRPDLPADMLVLLGIALLSFTLTFLGLWFAHYVVENARADETPAGATT